MRPVGKGLDVRYCQRQKVGNTSLFVDRVDLHSWFLQLDSLPLYRLPYEAAKVGVLGGLLPDTIRADYG